MESKHFHYSDTLDMLRFTEWDGRLVAFTKRGDFVYYSQVMRTERRNVLKVKIKTLDNFILERITK